MQPSDHPLKINLPSAENSIHSATLHPSSWMCKSCFPVAVSHNLIPSSPQVANTASNPLFYQIKKRWQNRSKIELYTNYKKFHGLWHFWYNTNLGNATSFINPVWHVDKREESNVKISIWKMSPDSQPTITVNSSNLASEVTAPLNWLDRIYNINLWS